MQICFIDTVVSIVKTYMEITGNFGSTSFKILIRF